MMSHTPATDWFQALRKREGAEGVESWFYLECYMADHYEPWGTWSIKLPAEEWCRILRRNARTLQRFLRTCRDLDLLDSKTSRHVIEISYRNLLHRKDNHSGNLEAPSKSMPSSDPENRSSELVPEPEGPAVASDEEPKRKPDKRYRAHVCAMLKRHSIHSSKSAVDLAISIHRPPGHLFSTIALVLQAQSRPQEMRERWLVTAADYRAHPPLQRFETEALDLIRSFNFTNKTQVDKDPTEFERWQLELTGGHPPPAKPST